MTVDREASQPVSATNSGAGEQSVLELIRGIATGETLDLRDAQIDADLLRRLILNQIDGCPVTPIGVRIRNAEIVGRLDLEGVDVAFPLSFNRVTMRTGGQQGSIIARDARIRRLNISNSTLAGAIIADRSHFDNGIIIAGGRIGGLSVRGAQIGGALSIEGTHFGDGKVALLAAGARLTGPLVLRRGRAHGEVRLQRSQLEAGLRADDLTIMDEGAGLYCDSARIGGDVQLSNARIDGPVRFANASVRGGLIANALAVNAPADGVFAAGLEISQSLELANASIKGTLDLEGAKIGKRFHGEGLEIDGSDTAISADVIHIGGNWEMPKARLVGQICCPGARISGQFRCTAARIYGAELAIRADGARIDGGVYFSRAVVSGCVRFPASEIGNQFRFSGATIKVADGPALIAPGAKLARDVEFNAGFQTTGGIVLDQARIHGNCDLTASHIKSSAIVRGAINPASREVNQAALRSDPDEIAVGLVDTEIDRLEMPSRADERPQGIVDLSRARVGAYVDWAATWPPQAGKKGNRGGGARTVMVPDHLVLDGFTYEHLVNPTGVAIADVGRMSGGRAGRSRINWLMGQAPADTSHRFKPQSWVYLSKQLTIQGLDRDARLITIERRRRERSSRWSTVLGRWESRLLDWLALYGFNPWRTVAWMAVVVLLFAGVWSWAASHCTQTGCFDEQVFVTSRQDAYSPERFASRYPPFHPVAYSFDVFVPFVSFGYEDHWRPNVSHGALVTWRLPHMPAFIGGETEKERIFANVTITTGGILYALVIVEKILGLILTSLMLTGFTGLLRSHD